MLSLSSRLISLLFVTVSSIADSISSLQADDPSSSLTSESYGPPNFPLLNIEDGSNLEILSSNVEPQQSEQSKSSHSCSSNSNMDTNRSNRKLRLRGGSAMCGWNDEPWIDAIPSRFNGFIPLKVGTYIAGGTLSDKWGVCGAGFNVVAIPVCTPVNLADSTGDAMTSLSDGFYTDLLMARLCTVPSRLLQSETHSTEPFCQRVGKSWN